MLAKILLITSDATLGKHLSSLLREKHYDCHYAPSLPAGLERLGQDSYNLVILDIELLGGNPAARVRQLRGANPGLRLVGLDSLAEHRPGEGAVSPFDAVIPKPFVADPLLAALPALVPPEAG